MLRCRSLGVIRCVPPVNSSFRCVSIIFGFCFTFIIILIFIIEVHRIVQSRDLERYKFKYSQSLSNHRLLMNDAPESTVTYGIVIDCGSSGSRVFIYYWPKHSGNPKELLKIQPLKNIHAVPLVMKIEPGISEYGIHPDNASLYLDRLLSYAASHIPDAQHKQTLLYILATAGMRLLPGSQQRAILRNLYADIPKKYSFLTAPSDFEVISGKQEGVYTWLAINYMLGSFLHDNEHDHDKSSNSQMEEHVSEVPHARRPSVGIIDMGGASVQIAFEVPSTFHLNTDNVTMNLIADVSLGCKQSDQEHQYRLYVATFLGMGANSARVTYEKKLIENQSTKRLNGETSLHNIPDPCLPRSMPYVKTTHSGKRYFIGTGDFKSCRNSVIPLLNLTKECATPPCFMNGVYATNVDYNAMKFYGFSEFWYSTNDILGIGGKYTQDVFHEKAAEFCSTNWTKLLSKFRRKMYPLASFHRLRFQCFKSAWMSAILHDGLHFPSLDPNFLSVNHINGHQVHWSLGALLHRSRYLPLREVERHQLQQSPSHHTTWFTLPSSAGTTIFSLCFIIVIISIFLYIRHLRSASLHRTLGLHRVPSMGYFKT